MEELSEFLSKMSEQGLDPGDILADATVHRFPTWGDRSGEASGAYWHNGRVGWFQDWRTMEKPQVVKGKLTEADRAALAGSFNGNRQRVSRKALEAGIRKIWDAGTDPDGHPYLTKKKIKPITQTKQYQGKLIIPIFDIDGKLNGLQRIDSDGNKRFLAGTRKKNSFFSIPGSKELYVVCEGFATGASIYEASGFSVAVAFDAGNILSVARQFCKKVGPDNVIIAGDNDSWKAGQGQPDTGRVAALKAARATGTRVALPVFKNPDGKHTTDFNDLSTLEGFGAVRAQLEAATDASIEIGAKLEIPTFKDTTSKPTEFNDLAALEVLDTVSAQTEAAAPISKIEYLKAEIEKIIKLDPLEQEAERSRLAKEYDVRKSAIDKYICDLSKSESDCDSIVEEVEPAADPVDGAKLADGIMTGLKRRVILPDGAAEAVTLWTMLTYTYDAFNILPILGVISPTKRCGKSTLIEILLALSNRGLSASNLTSAALFRTIEKYSPTLLIDEADTFLKDNDELRGVLNSGHTRALAYVIRVEGEDHEPRKFSTWGPKAIGMIGTLPDTLEDRSIVLKLARKMPNESIIKTGLDFAENCLDTRARLRRWANDNIAALKYSEVKVPPSGNDRADDNWYPLFCIAHAVGSDWPDKVANSMQQLIDVSGDEAIGTKLLSDIRDIFSEQSADRIFSKDLIERLQELSDSPWADWNRGKGLSTNGLSRLLKPFGVKSKNVRIDLEQYKGYHFEWFQDAFNRYIPTVTNVPPSHPNDFSNLGEKQSVPQYTTGTDEKCDNQLNLFNWDAGTDENTVRGGKNDFDTEKNKNWEIGEL